MYSSRKATDESPSPKIQRAMKRARGKRHEETTWEPGEHSQHLESIRKRRSALRFEDTGQQISNYFDSE